ncbi:MAG: SDR family oxidoreductase [Actinomycetota bacterium]
MAVQQACRAAPHRGGGRLHDPYLVPFRTEGVTGQYLLWSEQGGDPDDVPGAGHRTPPYKIRSNCLCPVVADTPMGERFLKSAQGMYGFQLEQWDFNTAKDIARSTVPLGDICTPLDVAYAAVYLASDESRMVSGTYILIDGASRAG